MAMALASKEKKGSGVKFSSSVPRYISTLRRTAKEVSATVEKSKK